MKGWRRDRTVQYRTWYGKNEKRGLKLYPIVSTARIACQSSAFYSAASISLRAIRMESLCETGAAEGNTESEGVFCPIILIEGGDYHM